MANKKQQRKRYSPEFKAEAVKMMETVKHTTVARQLDITVSMLYRWRTALRKHAEDAFPGNGNEREDDELTRLRRENARLRMERDFLKKTAIFFAKDAE